MFADFLTNFADESSFAEWLKASPDKYASYSDSYAECSNCHERVCHGWSMKYCPNCGAMMKRKEKNDENQKD